MVVMRGGGGSVVLVLGGTVQMCMRGTARPGHLMSEGRNGTYLCDLHGYRSNLSVCEYWECKKSERDVSMK